MTPAPSSVPAIALGMTTAGFSERAAMQQTSSKPMKPKKRREAPEMVPPAPWGKNVS